MPTPPVGSTGVVTAKGDLFVFDGSDLRRLPVGADGYLIRALASDPLGAVWSDPSVIPGIGYTVGYGSNFQNNGQQGNFFRANGEGDSNNVNVLGPVTELVVTKAGTVKRVGWDRETIVGTTIVALWINGVVPVGGIISLPTQFGALLLATQIPVAAGDRIAVEYDSGIAPQDINLQVFIE